MDHAEFLLLSLASVFVLGMSAQWLAWRMRLPSILLLLLFGFAAGPITGFLQPNKLLGELLFPIVSLSVGLILFEGGLSLRVSELREAGKLLRNLLTVGAAVTWLLSAAAAYWLLDLRVPIALLLGAILVVTGPTVIGPLLRDIRPVGRVGPIAKWEGIVIDPIGAVLAVLVFEATEQVHTSSLWGAIGEASNALLRTVVVGGLLGAVAAWILVFLLRRYAIPDHLQNPVALMGVIAAFAGSNLLQEESGLLAVTVMGVILANQSSITVRHIVEFKENLRVVLIASLFILLAARLSLDELGSFGWRNAAFVAWLMLVVRPVAVWLSSFGADLSWRELVFLSWFAPRGIVAAAVASVFALRLGPGGESLVQATFLVIISTVTIYGLTAGPLARRLGLAMKDPQGVLIVGAHAAARAMAKALQSAGFHVLVVDSSRANIQTARMEGLRTYHASILSDHVLDEIDLGGIGRLLALTSNDEVNSLAAIHFSDVFGRSEVYQLAPKGDQAARTKTASHLLRGRILFGRDVTHQRLEQRFARPGVVKKTKLTAEFTIESFRSQYGDDALVLFIINDTNGLIVCAADNGAVPRPGQTIISVVTETERPEAGK